MTTIDQVGRFAAVRLKVLLALCRAEVLDAPGFCGSFNVAVGSNGQVKTQVVPALAEVRLDTDHTQVDSP